MVHPHDLDDLGVPPWLRWFEILQPLSRSIPSFESAASRLLLYTWCSHRCWLHPHDIATISVAHTHTHTCTHSHTHIYIIYAYAHTHIPESQMTHFNFGFSVGHLAAVGLWSFLHRSRPTLSTRPRLSQELHLGCQHGAAVETPSGFLQTISVDSHSHSLSQGGISHVMFFYVLFLYLLSSGYFPLLCLGVLGATLFSGLDLFGHWMERCRAFWWVVRWVVKLDKEKSDLNICENTESWHYLMNKT